MITYIIINMLELLEYINEFKNEPEIQNNKYVPKTINELIGCTKQINVFVSWLKSFNINKKNNKNKKPNKKKQNIDTESEDENIIESSYKKKEYTSCIFITGAHGSGKTTFVQSCLISNGYTIKNINISSIDNTNNIITHNVFNNDARYAYIIDNIETVTTANEKNIIMELIKNNSVYWWCPIILIGGDRHKKFNIQIKKECFNIQIYKPTNANLCSVLERICISENMKFENEQVINIIIQQCQSDYSRLILMIHELQRTFSNKTITQQHIENYMKNIALKNIEMTIFENTINLFSSYTDIDNTVKIYNSDRTNIPLMIHQNHFNAINNYIKPTLNKFDVAYDVTDSLSKGDVIDNFTYSDQNWSLQEITCFYSCTFPSYKINL